MVFAFKIPNLYNLLKNACYKISTSTLFLKVITSTCMFTLTSAYGLTYFSAKCVQNRILKAYSIDHSFFTFKSLYTFLLRWAGFYVYNILRTDKKLRPTKHCLVMAIRPYLAKPPNQKCQRRSTDLFHFSKDIRCFNWNLRNFFALKNEVNDSTC